MLGISSGRVVWCSYLSEETSYDAFKTLKGCWNRPASTKPPKVSKTVTITPSPEPSSHLDDFWAFSRHKETLLVALVDIKVSFSAVCLRQEVLIMARKFGCSELSILDFC